MIIYILLYCVKLYVVIARLIWFHLKLWVVNIEECWTFKINFKWEITCLITVTFPESVKVVCNGKPNWNTTACEPFLSTPIFFAWIHCWINYLHGIQGGSNMTGTDLCVNKPHCAAAVRPWKGESTTSTLPPARVRTCSVLSGSC